MMYTMPSISQLFAQILGPPTLLPQAQRLVVNGHTTVQRLSSIEIKATRNHVQCIAFSLNGDFMALGGIDGVLDVSLNTDFKLSG